MGIWKAIHYAIDPKGAAELDKRHPKPGAFGGETLWQSFTRNRRASRWADQYWRDNEVITRVERMPLPQDIGHPPGCTCRWCGG